VSAAAAAGVREVLVDVNIGLPRCGCLPSDAGRIADLARATGLDERLDPDAVARMLDGIEPMDEALRSSGHYGPKVEVPEGADEQTRLLAFLGRTP
jgi:hypothetical protein